MKLGSTTCAEAAHTGRRYTADEAQQNGISHGTCEKGQSVVEAAKDFINAMSPGPPKDTQFLQEMKKNVFKTVVTVPDESVSQQAKL